MDNLAKALAALSPDKKALFLAKVIHAATVNARFSYVKTEANPERDFDHPDAIILRDANNFVHRMAGLIMDALAGSEWAPNNTIVDMIEEHFRASGFEPPFTEWLNKQP